MYKRQAVLTAAVLSVAGLGLASSPAWAQAQTDTNAQQQQQQPAAAAAPADKAGATDAQPGAQPAAHQSGQAQASEAEVRQALSQAANAVVGKNALQNISQQVCQKSSQKLGDLSQAGDQTAQLDQSVDQLKQAYKDKYQQDLDLSSNPDNVFTAQFFQIGGIGDQARQASGQIAPDSGAAGASDRPAAQRTEPGAADNKAASSGEGAAGVAGSAASAAGDAAQTASDKMMQHTTVTIPAQGDLQETKIHLVKEGNQWKVALPRDTDAKQLSQKIQQHLGEAAQSKDKWPADAAQAQQAIAHHALMVYGQAGPSDHAAGAGQPAATPQ